MVEVVIRHARLEDLAALPAIEASAALAFDRIGQALADGSPASSPQSWAPALRDGLLWVAQEADGALAGFLAGEITADGLYIQEVDVRLDRQRQGLGRALIGAAVAAARARRLAAVTLTTFADIAWNAPFYASLGFGILAPTEVSPSLAAHLQDEAARGFTGRCAMRLRLLA